MALSFPYNQLNLYRNPFGELDQRQRQEIAMMPFDILVEWLRHSGVAVQFIGKRGSGKTSHLLALRRFFPGSPYVHVGEGGQPEIPSGAPLFIDEAQRLKKRRRKKVFGRRASVIVATHIDLRHELQRAGLRVHTFYPGWILNADRLALIFNRRIERFRRGPGPVPTIRAETIKDLMSRYGEDVRRMEVDLYERFQSLRRVSDV